MSTFKNFTPQDYSIVPFNAHKQYNFTSASAASNSVRLYSSSFTSESISLFSSASSAHGGDGINNTKYNQLDNLFYRNFNKVSSVSTGKQYIGQNSINVLKHKRVLYNKANIVSIPAGLYGHEIKPNSIFISSSLYEFKDDGYGNLLLNSDNISNYETDVRSNVLNIGPVKGFKKYDLNVYDGYTVNGIDQYFYLDGVKRVNQITSYTTNDDGSEYDDSYFYNRIFYKNSNFSEQTLFRGSFPTIEFNGINSELKIPHSSNFNFNKGDDFTISFWANVKKPTVGQLSFTANAISASNTNNEDLTLISSDGTTKKYRSSASSNGTVLSSGIISFQGKIQNAITKINNLSSSIKHANGHNGKFDITTSGNAGAATITLKQLDTPSTIGTIGNTLVTTTSQFNVLTSVNAAATFTQGTDIDYYLISKSTTKEAITNNPLKLHNSASNPYNIPFETSAEPQFPYEVYAFNKRVFFKRSDGNTTTTYSASYTPGTQQHITCRYKNSQMEIFINGIGSGTSGSDNIVNQTQNTANVYIGNKGSKSKFLSGSLSQINIFSKSLTNTQILKHYSSSNNSPYVGNVFYQNGFITLTHPSYIGALDGTGDGVIDTLQFQGSHQIYEHEYQCTIEEQEFNNTSNISARKIGSINESEMAGFQSSSAFKPYVTTIGLYNKNNELLVVGKLASPIKMSNETDTTFVLRWDT